MYGSSYDNMGLLQAMQSPQSQFGTGNTLFQQPYNGTQQQAGLFDSIGGLKGLQGGIGIAGGLMGLYGMYNQNRIAKEAMGMARQDQAMRQKAADQYSQFRADTKSAFA